MFQIQPGIQTFYGSKAQIYLRDFACCNTLLNIKGTEAERTLTINRMTENENLLCRFLTSLLAPAGYPSGAGKRPLEAWCTIMMSLIN